MEHNEVKELVSLLLDPVKKDLGEIKDTLKPIPGLVERLSSYKKIESKVQNHEYILCGTKEKPGIVHDINVLKNKNKYTLNWIFKIAACIGTLFGIAATIKAFIF